MIRDLIVKNRTYRRFHQDRPIDRRTLIELVDMARLSASGGNLQPLKYALSHDPRTNAHVFPTLLWAGYIADWPGPVEGERPSGYIVILGDTSIRKGFGCDHGIAAQSIMLAATERGLGGCMIATIDVEALRQALDIAPQYEVLLVLALGVPKETVVIDDLGPDGDIRYWRDHAGVHHVPKRALSDIIVDPGDR